ncbi:MAG: antitermination protein NusG [Bacteroidetes bacterium]|nr:MAG: antitermination protein NusG [Bacteroidota bacterium]
MRKWYAVYTKPRREKKVHQLLTEKNVESYCPLNRVKRKWSDRLKTVEEPLFKSYVFVKIRNEDQSEVRMTNGVVNFVYWQGKPAVVKDREIEVIRKFLNEYDNVIAEPIELGPDSEVRIQRGIFMDKEAKVIKVMGNKVQVIIESIGYSLVASLDKSNLTLSERSRKAAH